jgi:dextranase
MGRYEGAPASLDNQYTWDIPNGWATPQLRLMNNRHPGWQNYIYNRIHDAIAQLGFDGWHMDSLIMNWQAYDYWGNSFNVFEFNPDFINNARAYYGSGTPLVQNMIDGNGIDWMSGVDVDFIYSELWGGHAAYNSLKELFDDSRSYTSKPVVYAAYMNYNKPAGYFNEPGVRLANAAIFASGASHIELGDGNQMLSNEYFPNQDLQMTDSLRSVMRTYYDFLVGYENLLRDDTVSAEGSVSAAISGVSTSTNASAQTVWILAKKRPGYNIIHLINLLNNDSTELSWNDADGTYSPPPIQTNLPVKMYYTGSIAGGRLFYATPDSDFGAAQQLSFTTGSDGGGNYINFMVPQLQYWDMIWLELKGRLDAESTIQAEDYDTYSAVGTETCYDSGGGKNVGFVNNLEGDSYLGFGNVNFAVDAVNVSARVASDLPNGSLQFRLDSPAGPLIATVPVGDTGGWQSWVTKNASVSGASGVHNLYVVFRGAASNLNWFTFALAPHSDGDLTFDGKVTLQDVAELGSGWQADYILDTLQEVADDWLVGTD